MTVVLAFLVMLLVVAAMSIGVMVGRKPIAGSCGGARALGLGGECSLCGRKPGDCESADDSLSRIPAARRAAALSFEADPPPRRDGRTL